MKKRLVLCTLMTLNKKKKQNLELGQMILSSYEIIQWNISLQYRQKSYYKNQKLITTHKWNSLLQNRQKILLWKKPWSQLKRLDTKTRLPRQYKINIQ